MFLRQSDSTMEASHTSLCKVTRLGITRMSLCTYKSSPNGILALSSNISGLHSNLPKFNRVFNRVGCFLLFSITFSVCEILIYKNDALHCNMRT